MYAIGLTVVILKVAVGLGFVIFVHELGHFAVAKLCGVKCEKFYLGFDIAGLKFCKFRWGETEYGIGILPLGGYVKMLGQEDNPAKLREEMERAKAGEGEGRGERGEGRALQCPEWQGGRSPKVRNPKSEIPQSPLPTPLSPLRSPQLSGQERAEAHGDHLGRRDDERDLRLPDGRGGVLDRRAGDALRRRRGLSRRTRLAGRSAVGRRDPRNRRQEDDAIPRPANRHLAWATSTSRRACRSWCAAAARSCTDHGQARQFPRRFFHRRCSGQNTTRLLANRKTWLVFNRHARHSRLGGRSGEAGVPQRRPDRADRRRARSTTTAKSTPNWRGRRTRRSRWSSSGPKKTPRARPTGIAASHDNSGRAQSDARLGLGDEDGPVTAIQADSPAAAAGIQPGDRIVQPAAIR